VVASCADGVRSGHETDIDCGGDSCPPCFNGNTCAVSRDCYSASCSDGVCCNSPCDGTCVSCNQPGYNLGRCIPLPAESSDSLCVAESPASCGLSGLCDGFGNCAKYPPGRACTLLGACTSGHFATEGVCDGQGTCQPPQEVDCSPYMCGGFGCRDSCTIDADCVPPATCMTGSCVVASSGSGSGGTTAMTGNSDSLFSTDGFGMNTAWMGAVYTASWGTGNIAPRTPAVTFVGKQVCVSGTVPADPTNTGANGVLVGWNLSQARGRTTAAAWTPTGTTGVAITLSGTVTGAVVQIDEVTQKTSWCYPLTTTSPTMIPWTSFNTTCYNLSDPRSAAFSPITPIRDIAIIIGSRITATSFSFCWINAAPY